MDRRPRLNLQHLTSVRERELLDAMDDTEFDRILRGEVHLPESAGGQRIGGYGAPIAQDAIRALFLRQGRIHKVP